MAFNRTFVFVFLKVKECHSPLLYESQQLLIPLEELEKQMTFFYDSLGKINEILTVLEHEAQSSALFKQKQQVRRNPLEETKLFYSVCNKTEMVLIVVEIQLGQETFF